MSNLSIWIYQIILVSFAVNSFLAPCFICKQNINEKSSYSSTFEYIYSISHLFQRWERMGFDKDSFTWAYKWWYSHRTVEIQFQYWDFSWHLYHLQLVISFYCLPEVWKTIWLINCNCTRTKTPLGAVSPAKCKDGYVAGWDQLVGSLC